MVRRLLALLAVSSLAVAGCSSDSKSADKEATKSSATAAGAKTIEVTLTDDGCEPRNIAAVAGPTTFKVTSEGSVSEFEVLDGNKMLGEAEHVTKDKEGSFSLTLAPGSYTTLCPGGAKYSQGTLEVADAGTGATADSAERQAAVAAYLTYVKAEADKLIAAAAPFVAAVKAGDLTQAKNSFAAARYHYETIEPIAESFGELDPALDAREGDVPEAEWTGFHRIEKALWEEKNVSGMAAVADKLAEDLGKLRRQIDTVELEPAQIANGAVELLNEVSTSKITGEEDRYSHTDLSDFDANLAGSKAAFTALQPLLAGTQQPLVDQLTARFADVKAALDRHASNDPAGNGFALYNTLSPEQTRELSTTLDTLAEPLSKVAALVLS